MIKHLPKFLFQSIPDFLSRPEFFIQTQNYLDNLKSANPSRASKTPKFAIGCFSPQNPFFQHSLQLSHIRSFNPAIFELNFNI